MAELTGQGPSSTKVTVFLICYNERLMIARTVHHYRTLLPGCDIVVCDNESTDDSTRIASGLGCRIHTWSTGSELVQSVKRKLTNTVWKDVREGWVLVCDMDEYLCVNQRQLDAEAERGTTVLSTRGFEIVGNSASPTLDDLDISLCDRGYFHPAYSKAVCFRREAIEEMNYTPGHHDADPVGTINYSKRHYSLYHMNCLGEEFFIGKNLARFERTKEARKQGMSTHYSDDRSELAKWYQERTEKAHELLPLKYFYDLSNDSAGKNLEPTQEEHKLHVRELEQYIQSAENKIKKQESRIDELEELPQIIRSQEKKVARQEAKIRRLEDRVEKQKSQITALYSSTSWRLAAPWRLLKRLFDQLGSTLSR